MLKPQLPSAVNYLYIFSAFIKSKPWRETCDDTFLNVELLWPHRNEKSLSDLLFLFEAV